MRPKAMYILGISSNVHDSAACLLKDGRVVAAAEEERFVREKHTDRFPANAVRFCLERAGITGAELDHVGFSWRPWRGVLRRAALLAKDPAKALGLLTGGPQEHRGSISRWAGMLRARRMLEDCLGARGAYVFHYLDHHRCHAASACFTSPFDEAAVITADGAGEIASTVTYRFAGGRITPLFATDFPHSLGLLYWSISDYLGFDVMEGPGKVMALAAYGEPSYLDVFREVVQSAPGGYRLDMRFFSFQYYRGYYTDRLVKRLGPPRGAGDEITKRHKDVAASLQARLEEVFLEMARALRARTGSGKLCLGGGVALNSVLSGRLMEEGIFDAVYVPYSPGDSGSAVGAAYWLNAGLGGPRVREPHAPYFGPEYDERTCARALDAAGVGYVRVDEPGRAAAELLAAGKVVGWFQGRMEFGPRALGNRSILADPRDPGVRDRINLGVKHREPFRPFAPAVLAGHVAEYFGSDSDLPYMSAAIRVKPDKAGEIPGVVHVDGTCRLQTVDASANRVFYGLIREFLGLTGVPMVLNTSFNVKGEPMVMSPDDAVRSYVGSGMDCLVMGKLVARKGGDVI